METHMNLEAAMDLADHAAPAPVSASLALKAMRREIQILRTALQEKDEPGLLRVLADIRWACNDCGTRMLPELVQYIGKLFEQAKGAQGEAVDPSMCTHRFLADPRVCSRCGWDFRKNGDPPEPDEPEYTSEFNRWWKEHQCTHATNVHMKGMAISAWMAARTIYTAPRAAVPDAVRFACWLVDHVEREMVTEESVQQWLSDYLTALESFLAGRVHVPAIGTPIKVEGDKLVTDRDTLHASPEYARQVAGAQRLAQERVQAKGARPRPGEEPSTWRALQSLECPHKDENAAHIWQDAILTAMRLMLDHAEQAKGAQGEAVAWLHTVTQGDGETDQALSFSPDSFPLDKQLGFRSLVAIPLYTAPRAAVPDGWKLVPVEPTDAMAYAALNDNECSKPEDSEVECAKQAYRAMLSAAPSADAKEVGHE